VIYSLSSPLALKSPLLRMGANHNKQTDCRAPNSSIKGEAPQMNDVGHEFAYQARWGKTISSIIIFTAMGVGTGYYAIDNNKGLVVKGIELTPQQATIFNWSVCVVGFAIAAWGIMSLIMRCMNPQRLIVGADGLHAPESMWSEAPTLIRYADIRSISSEKWRGERYLKVAHATGKLTIKAAKMESTTKFEELCRELEHRWQAVGRTPA
jgi:hypothetical protein